MLRKELGATLVAFHLVAPTTDHLANIEYTMKDWHFIELVASQICNVLFKLSAFIDLGRAVAVELISVLTPIISQR
jgi:hypothetical protein